MTGRCVWIKSGGGIHMQTLIYLLFIWAQKCRFEKTEEPGLIYTQTDFEGFVVESCEFQAPSAVFQGLRDFLLMFYSF